MYNASTGGEVIARDSWDQISGRQAGRGKYKLRIDW
jgi:hypothetical protein